jgi:acyl-CoA thioester hydrolase
MRFEHRLRVRFGECDPQGIVFNAHYVAYFDVGVEALGTTSLTTVVDVTRDGELLVAGRLRHVFVDARTWQKTPMPDWIRSGLSPYLVRSVD